MIKIKTKNAFAFRDFDAERILQRPYFRALRLPVSSDAEILETLKAADGDSIDALEKKISSTKKICYRLSEFLLFIKRHFERLGRLNVLTAKITGIHLSDLRGNSLAMEYLSWIPILGTFVDKFRKRFFELEKKTQRRYREEFGKRLKIERKKRGLTQKQLSEMIQISPTGYAGYEQGRNDPSVATLIRLAKILNLRENNLLWFS